MEGLEEDVEVEKSSEPEGQGSTCLVPQVQKVAGGKRKRQTEKQEDEVLTAVGNFLRNRTEQREEDTMSVFCNTGIPPDAVRQRYGSGTSWPRLCRCLHFHRARYGSAAAAVFTRDPAIILNLMYSPSTPKTTAIKCHALSFRPLPL